MFFHILQIYKDKVSLLYEFGDVPQALFYHEMLYYNLYNHKYLSDL